MFINVTSFCGDCITPLMVVGAETPLGTKIEIEVNIQSSSGGKVNILGGDSIGHYKKKEKDHKRV